MKNNEAYQALLDREKEGFYAITGEDCFNHLGIECVKYDKGKRYIRIEGFKQKIYLDKYLNFRLGKVSKDKQRTEKMKFTADFETTTNIQYKQEGNKIIPINEEKTRVWAYGVTNIYDTSKFNYGTSLNEFMELVKNLQSADIYFHNLKHDGSFILNWLHDNNWQHVERNELREGTYTCHIANGQYYSITLGLSNKSKSKHKQNKITFYDSFKIMPTSIKSLGESFLKDLEGEGKVSVDEGFYNRYRSIDHQLTDEEIHYLQQDCKVAAIAMKFMLDLGHSKSTIGSNAFTDFQTRFNKNFKYNYRDHFPVLPMGKLDENGDIDDKGNGWNSWIIKAYRGGYTYVPKKYRDKDVGKGIVFDVNSLYPYAMYTSLLPYGQPIWFDGAYKDLKPYEKRTHPLFIQKIRAEFRVKDKYLPIVPDRSKGRNFADYLESTKGTPIDLYLTNIDLELFLEHYVIIGEPEYIGGYCFKGKQEIFKEYIDHWREVKIKADQEGDQALRYIAKLFLNSLYGKFATRWDKPASNPVFNKDDILGFKKKVKWDDLTREEQEEAYIQQVKYPAMAVFITSYARKLMIESAQKNFDRFRYCDTDSLHLEGTEFPTNINIDHDKTGQLGLWKHECTFERARFIRSKTYVEDYKGKLHVTVAGMSKSCHDFVRWETFHEHTGELAPAGKGIFWGNMRPRIKPGGTVIDTDMYIIKENPHKDKE
jgi:hypothetical protein